jgi:hypothetical protein
MKIIFEKFGFNLLNGVDIVSFWENISPFNLPGGDIQSFILGLLQAFVGLAGLFAVAMIIYGGYTFITSSGNPDNAAKGQRILTNSVIGLVVVGIAWMIINFVVKVTIDAVP